jgi:hypothetical protein
MAEHGIFIGWGLMVTGRERQATMVFGEGIAYLTQLQQEGKIQSFEPVFLRPHGGDLGGFFLVRGERDALNAMLASPEWERLSNRVQAIATHYGVVDAFLGAETQRLAEASAGYTSDLT